jgi:CRP-like cAMP-binding protein
MDTTPDLRQAIGATWFGAGIPAPALDRLASLGRFRQAARGEAILTEGAPATELVLILSGMVGVTAREPGQGEVTLMTVEPGDIVGWSVLRPSMPSTASVRVLEPASLVVFPGEVLRDALARDPELSAAVHRQALDAVARRLLAALQQLMNLREYQGAGARGGSWPA